MLWLKAQVHIRRMNNLVAFRNDAPELLVDSSQTQSKARNYTPSSLSVPHF